VLPELFKYGNFSLQSYGLFLALSYFTAFFTLRFLAKIRGFPVEDFSNLSFFCLILGIIGSRIFFVFLNWSTFTENWISAFYFWSGGLVFYGGFIFCTLFLFWYFQKKKIPWRNGLDICAVAIALAHAVGRIGCLFAGCCHGKICHYPWGIEMHSSLVEQSLRGFPLHPTQLYESIGLFLIGIGGIFLHVKNNLAPGKIALLYVIFYSTLRFFVELFRGDTNRGVVPYLEISTSQAISVGLFLLAFGIFIRGLRRNN
jgi:phosphatidylglycerol---prolipoprotein diacylglyceryl transferase